MLVRVVNAAEAAARDAAAIAAGIPSRALMQRAGAAATAEITRRYPDLVARGVVVFAGPGNNGGDAWVVAGALASAGVRVRVVEVAEAKTPDARAERDHALPLIDELEALRGEQLIIDGILGTGAKGAPRGAIAKGIARVNELRERGATIVSLDVPSGLDASTGDATNAVQADLTLTFGTVKRGLLVSRGMSGTIVALDIGLGLHAKIDDAPVLVDEDFVADRVPVIPAAAHKGVRRRIAIVGGGEGMAGAAILAARSAMLSGVGMVRLLVAPINVPIVQTAVYEAMARAWPKNAAEIEEVFGEWAHGLLLGPGLGKSDQTKLLAERLLKAWRGPVVVDADALNVFEGEADRLGELLAGRPAIVTPHVNEFSRLAEFEPQDVLDHRFEIGAALARRLNAVVLLKGTPTVITSPGGDRLVSATGTPALASAGSGDLLAGIAATLLAQMQDASASAACAAWVHGRAGEIASQGRAMRGVGLDNVIAALPEAWRMARTRYPYPVMAELPKIGDE